MPGTKILITKPVKITDGFLEMDEKCFKVLGGEVDKLIEKWLVERDSTSEEFRIRSFENGGPPPFIPFEKRNLKDNRHKVVHQDLKGRKVLGNRDDDDEEQSDDEFEAERIKQLAEIDAVR